MEQTAGGAGPTTARFARSVMVLVALVILAGSSVLLAPPSRAATVQFMASFGGWEVGAFLSSTGHVVYCIEPGAFEPKGPQQEPQEVDTLPGFAAQARDQTGWDAQVTGAPISGPALQRMNWLLTTYGQTQDHDQAAAVQFALWWLRDDPGLDAWLDHHAGWVQNNGGDWHIRRASQMVDEARLVIEQSAPPQPAQPLEMRLEGAPKSGVVRYPAGTQQLSITGGSFVGGSAELVVGPEAGSASWESHENSGEWRSQRRVAVAGAWKQEYTHWPAAVTMHPPVEAAQQMLGAMVGPTSAVSEAVLDPVELLVDEQFSPVLTTQTVDYFVPTGGGTFADRVTFGLAEGSREWATRSLADGGREYAPVVAEGVLYGPMSAPPEVQNTAPADAPVAARARLVADQGPGEYLATTDQGSNGPGYYSWVWSIAESQQLPEIREAALLPEGYLFSDRFGLADESHLSPLVLRWVTDLQENELAIDNLVLRDDVTVSVAAGDWIRDASEQPIPARIRLTAYGLAEAPVRQSSVPEGVEELAREFVTVTEPGVVEAPPITLPAGTRGWVTVQACLIAEDQPEQHLGMVEEWCDDFGVSDETARVVEPSVRTEAQPNARVGDEIVDNAFVDGLVPQQADLGFTFYLRPEAGQPRFDAEWQRVYRDDGKPATWSAAEIARMSDEERCLAQPVATTERIPVSGTGRHTSPGITAQSAGTGYWVEDLAMPDSESGEPIEVHRGACGLANERTVIAEKPAQEPGLAITGAETHPTYALVLAGLTAFAGAAVWVGGRSRMRK